MSTIQDILTRLWNDYREWNPQVRQIHGLLEARGEAMVNDHLALRTFDDPRVDIDVLARPFLAGGYREGGRYDFDLKNLNARHYEHEDPAFPLVFISELRCGEFSEALQQRVKRLLDEVPAGLTERGDFAASGRPWEISFADYEKLRSESEYAAWVAAFGYRANHFTIFVNALKGFADIHELVSFLKEEGFELNESGGVIKGSPEAWLEQASTLASLVEVGFLDGRHEIPCCYYEFAQRYKMPDGRLFRGFIAKSADKIFESTDKR